MLPSLFAAMEQKVLRAHYLSLIWKSSQISSPVLPNPIYYGWLFNDHYEVYERTDYDMLVD